MIRSRPPINDPGRLLIHGRAFVATITDPGSSDLGGYEIVEGIVDRLTGAPWGTIIHYRPVDRPHDDPHGTLALDLVEVLDVYTSGDEWRAHRWEWSATP